MQKLKLWLATILWTVASPIALLSYKMSKLATKLVFGTLPPLSSTKVEPKPAKSQPKKPRKSKKGKK